MYIKGKNNIKAWKALLEPGPFPLLCFNLKKKYKTSEIPETEGKK